MAFVMKNCKSRRNNKILWRVLQKSIMFKIRTNSGIDNISINSFSLCSARYFVREQIKLLKLDNVVFRNAACVEMQNGLVFICL